jgi:hypothetical protein
MFEGFNQKTVSILLSIQFNNNREYFNTIKQEYPENVKRPLELLYHDLSAFLHELDPDMLFSPRKCISTPYKDARFNRTSPIKEYIYLRFLASGDKKNDIPGFFFDASADDMRCGINVYQASHAGICKIGCALRQNIDLLDRVLDASQFSISMGGAAEYKEVFQELKSISKEWLGRNCFMIYKCESTGEMFFSRDLYHYLRDAFTALFPVYALIKGALLRK